LCDEEADGIARALGAPALKAITQVLTNVGG